jgi:hypothetical protein
VNESSATIGRIAGFFAILAGGLVAVGAFPAWVTLHSGEIPSPHNAFDIISGLRDASICFALAAVLFVVGFAMTARPVLVARGLCAVAGISAAIWAGLLFFLLVPQLHDWIAPTARSTSVSIDLGLWLIAGSGALGILAALTAAAAHGRPMLVPAHRPDTRPSRTALSGVIEQVPTLRVKRAKAESPTWSGIEKEDAALLLKAAEDAGLRDEVIIRLLVLNGLRASEITHLRIADVGEECGRRTLQVRRRGGRITIEALSSGTRHALERLLAERGDSAPEAPLFVGRGGRPLSWHALARVTRRLGRVVSISTGRTGTELNPS